MTDQLIFRLPEFQTRYPKIRLQTPADLAEHVCAAFLGCRAWTLQRQAKQVEVNMDGSAQSNSFTLLLTWAQQGCGVVLLPEIIMPNDGSVQKILSDWQGQAVPISILTTTR